jgi:DNA polymerase elongation subunit (family B)
MNEFYTNAFLKNNKIYLRGYKDGVRFKEIIPDYKPYLFKGVNRPATDDDAFRTIYGEAVKKIKFDNIKEAYIKIAEWNKVGNLEYYGFTQFLYTYLNDRFPNKFKFDPARISVVSIDIEVDSSAGFPDIEKADSEITAITLVKNAKSITFCTKQYTAPEGNQAVICTDEAVMLKAFLTYWNDDEWIPDVVTGWSSDLFDLPYLINRVRRLFGEDATKYFSPFRIAPESREIIRSKGQSKNFEDRKDVVYEIPGIAVLDYLQLYKKFTNTSHPSYALKNISQIELGETKVDYSQYGDLNTLYAENPQLYFEYNIHDAVLVSRMDKKLGFINRIIAIAYMAKANYVDSLVTLRPWDVIIHNYLLERGVVIPQYKQKETRELLGGYVKEPQAGMHKWVVSFDFDSLYPRVISQQNISPDTFVTKIHASSPEHIVALGKYPVYDGDGDYSVCANGTVYRKDIRGFIPAVIDEMVGQRETVKNQMQALKKAGKKDSEESKQLDYYQQAIKVLGNGLYGALSNPYFRWYDINLAEAVTTTSQVATRYVEKELNVYFNKVYSTVDVDYIVASDTDSVYVDLSHMITSLNIDESKAIDFIDMSSKKAIEPLIDRYCDELFAMSKGMIKKLHMKRESICDKVIWRESKMYVLSIWDQEGVRNEQPEIKMKGIETVRASTPMVCRDKIKEALKIILYKDEPALQKFVHEFKKEWMELPFIEMAFPRTCNGISEYYDPETLIKKKTPVHVRASIMYNEMLKELELTNKYQAIKDKDKVRWIYLRLPNPFKTDVIAAPDEMPNEFEVDQYIDRQKQWEKAFLGPVESFTKIIGWQSEKKASLAQFM